MDVWTRAMKMIKCDRCKKVIEAEKAFSDLLHIKLKGEHKYKWFELCYECKKDKINLLKDFMGIN